MTQCVAEKARQENIRTLKHNAQYKVELEETNEKNFKVNFCCLLQNSIQTQFKINEKISSIKKAYKEKCRKMKEQKQEKERIWHENKRVADDNQEEKIEKVWFCDDFAAA